MAESAPIRAGRAFVELFADDSKLVRGLNRAAGKIKAFGGSIAGIGKWIGGMGAAVTVPILLAAKAASDSGARLWDMSKRTGLAVETLSLLDYAAAQTGSDLETVEGAFRRMQKSVAGVADQAEGTTGKLDELGISAAEIAGLSPEKQFALIAAAIRQIEHPTERAAAAMKVFGRSGTAMLPLIDQFDQLSDEASEFGLIKSTESARMAKQFSDAMTLIGRVIKSVWGAVGTAVMPMLREQALWIAKVAAVVRDWIKQNSGLVVSVFKLATIATFAGAGLVVLGKAILGLGAVLGIAATALGIISTVLGAILTPVGLITAALVALGGYFLYTSGAGEKALAWLCDQFELLKDTVLRAWGGITEALAAGDLGLAMKVAWATIKMLWQEGINWLYGHWVEFKKTFMAVWTEAAYGLSKVFAQAWYGLQKVWLEVVTFIGEAWAVFSTGAVSIWRGAQVKIGQMYAELMKLLGVWDEETAAGAQRILQEDYTREVTARHAKMISRLQALDQQRAKGRTQIDAEEKAALEELEREREQAHIKRGKQYAQDLEESKAAAEAAREEWEKALKEAEEKRKDAWLASFFEDWERAGAPKGGPPPIDIRGTSKLAVAGTFSALAAGRMAGGGPLERIARGQEQQLQNDAKKLQKMDRQIAAVEGLEDALQFE